MRAVVYEAAAQRAQLHPRHPAGRLGGHGIVVMAVEEDQGWDIADPRPAALIEAVRAFGYSPESAVADLVDNSLTAGASVIDIDFHWAGSASVVAIRDNGKGMSHSRLVDAMRAGDRSPLDERKSGDLGRFGLGLKTASFSQCRELTVMSSTARTPVAVRRWDLDFVGASGEWRLLRSPPVAMGPGLAELSAPPSPGPGTTVVWTKLDRLSGDARMGDRAAHTRFLKTADRIRRHTAMTFHRFLNGRGKVVIRINGTQVEPWDPFMTHHPATQQLEAEALRLHDREVLVRPYVLPHRSKLSEAEQGDGAGLHGWNAHQGFYLYRGRRLVIPGDWLGTGFTKEEHCKLARIAVDIPTALDHDWQIDVKKSTARPPGNLMDAFRRIATVTRAQAQEVYRHRGRVMVRSTSQPFVFAWQEVKARDGSLRYVINRRHPVVESAMDAVPAHNRAIEQLLRFVEETVPVPLIGLRVSEAVDAVPVPFANRPPQQLEELFKATLNAMVSRGVARETAIDKLAVTEPFANFPEIAASAAAEDGH